MKITEIRISLARTIVPPGGDRYQPVKLDAGLTATIEEGDDLVKVRATLQAELRGVLEETYRVQIKPKAAAQTPAAAPQPAGAPQQPAEFRPAQPAPAAAPAPADEPLEY